MALQRIPNGVARRRGCTAKDVDPMQLKIGTQVEMEHTSDRRIAQQIALDHICESDGVAYYVPGDVRHEHLVLKRREYEKYRRAGFGGATCSTSPRWVRGGVGFLVGTMLGGMIGGGIALAVTTTQFEITAPIEAAKRTKNMAVLASGVTILGAIAGLTLGAAKPEC